MSKPERRFKTSPNRWGEGKVHRLIYSYDNQVWYVACRSPYNDPYGAEVDKETEVTCRTCGGGVST